MSADRAAPSSAAVALARATLAGRVLRTPVVDLTSDRIASVLPTGAEVAIKLELFQQAGSFKARGVLLGIDGLNDSDRRAGVVAASGGNHALAVAWAAKAAGVSATVCIPKTADPARIEGCRAFGADVRLMDDIAAAFDEAQQLSTNDGRAMLHPFEGAHMTLGAATCGAEYAEDRPDRDIFVVPVGGGGLIGGMATGIKQLLPKAEIWGVEPVGADTMSRSFASGVPESIAAVDTIADSLGSPFALPHSFAVARETVDGLVRIEDDDMRRGMGLLADALKIMAEPACAASLAAILGPLRDRCEGRRVGIIACGSNIGLARYTTLTQGS